MKDKVQRTKTAAAPSSPFYVLGMLGALVYYVQIVDGFWNIVVAFLKAAVWPAFLTYDLLKFISG